MCVCVYVCFGEVRHGGITITLGNWDTCDHHFLKLLIKVPSPAHTSVVRVLSPPHHATVRFHHAPHSIHPTHPSIHFSLIPVHDLRHIQRLSTFQKLVVVVAIPVHSCATNLPMQLLTGWSTQIQPELVCIRSTTFQPTSAPLYYWTEHTCFCSLPFTYVYTNLQYYLRTPRKKFTSPMVGKPCGTWSHCYCYGSDVTPTDKLIPPTSDPRPSPNLFCWVT